MALTPTQMGTKSRTISSPNPNIRTRPNGLGRSPKMGRVQQIQPYQLGELVETPLGLRRITGVSPFTINVDLGPRSELNASVQAGGTSLVVKAFKTSVSLQTGDIIIVGNSVDSYRETVKVSSAVTTSTSSTTTISISNSFINSHAKGDKVVIQKLPPNFDGQFVEIEELKILGDNSYAYVIPSVPKSPRYISRTGDFGNDDVKNEEEFTYVDPTDNFQKYDSILAVDVVPFLHATSFPVTPSSDYQPYRFFLAGRNSDGTARTRVDVFGDDASAPGATIEGKDPMLITCEVLLKGSTEHQHAETQEFGSYTGNTRVLKFDLPTNFESSLPLAARKATFVGELLATMFREPGDPFTDLSTMLPTVPDGVGSFIKISHQAPDDLETDAQRAAAGRPTTGGFAHAVHSSVIPPLFGYTYQTVSEATDPGGDRCIYLFLTTTQDDRAVAEQMHQTEQITGTISVSSGSTTVTGVGTQFTSELSTGATKNNIIRFEGNTTSYRVQSITNDTSLVLTTTASASFSGAKAFRTSFSNVPIIKDKFTIIDPAIILKENVEIRGTSATGKDNSGSISARVFLELPQGQARWSSTRALDSGKGDETGFVDAFQSPEDQPNETFGFYVGKNEESLPYMKASNKTGETVLDGRVKLSGFIFTAPRVEAQELKKMKQRAGYYKAKLFPHTGFFPNLEDRPDGPPDGWEPRSRKIERSLLLSLRELSIDVRKQIRR